MPKCNCLLDTYKQGELPDIWFPQGTTLDVEVISLGDTIGIFTCFPECEHEHNVAAFIVQALTQAGFDVTLAHYYYEISRLTTLKKICTHHNFASIEIAQKPTIKS